MERTHDNSLTLPPLLETHVGSIASPFPVALYFTSSAWCLGYLTAGHIHLSKHTTLRNADEQQLGRIFARTESCSDLLEAILAPAGGETGLQPR